jgi:hypothetical protein
MRNNRIVLVNRLDIHPSDSRGSVAAYPPRCPMLLQSIPLALQDRPRGRYQRLGLSRASFIICVALRGLSAGRWMWRSDMQTTIALCWMGDATRYRSDHRDSACRVRRRGAESAWADTFRYSRRDTPHDRPLLLWAGYTYRCDRDERRRHRCLRARWALRLRYHPIAAI